MTVTSTFMRPVLVEDGWTTPANSRRDPYTAAMFRSVLGDTRPESFEADPEWDARQARAEERARIREEM